MRTKQLAMVSAALALSAAPAFAQPPRSERTAAAVMRVEQQWLSALNRRDVTALARILGREFVDSDYQGNAFTRQQYLTFFARPASHPPPHVHRTFRDTRVRFVADDDVAIVTGVVVTRPVPASGLVPEDLMRYSRFTDVFVWRNGRWQAVSGQETHFLALRG
jgi:ketosteroid isomerase-like protein